MAVRSPLEVTVGKDTPVHIHVSRSGKTKTQALSESLSHEYQKLGRENSAVSRPARHSSKESSDPCRDLCVDDLKHCHRCHAAHHYCQCHRPLDIVGRWVCVTRCLTVQRLRPVLGPVYPCSPRRGGQPGKIPARSGRRAGTQPPPARVDMPHAVCVWCGGPHTPGAAQTLSDSCVTLTRPTARLSA